MSTRPPTPPYTPPPDPGRVRLTHVGGPTMLIETGGWRILTDPTFDPPGRRYGFGLGTASTKLAGPALTMPEIGDVDAVLLTHDHHADNLDDAGRALLARLPVAVTTVRGASRLGGTARGLAPDDETVLVAPGRPPLTVRATPCRHGPPLSRRLVGDVIGFAITWDPQPHGALWVSGDTVLHRDLLRFADDTDVGIAILHLGGVRFPITGPVRYTMTAADAVRLCRRLRPHVAIPVHYEGWSHFAEGRAAVERRLGAAPAGLQAAFRWLPLGSPVDLDA